MSPSTTDYQQRFYKTVVSLTVRRLRLRSQAWIGNSKLAGGVREGVNGSLSLCGPVMN